MLDFYWDEWNIEHIGEHRVSKDEAEDAVSRAKRPFPQTVGQKRYLVRGQTKQGRYLQVVYVERSVDTIDVNLLDPEVRLNIDRIEAFFYVIHARDLTAGEKRSVRKR
jgi:uncharacterized DUF497 family protein